MAVVQDSNSGLKAMNQQFASQTELCELPKSVIDLDLQIEASDVIIAKDTKLKDADNILPKTNLSLENEVQLKAKSNSTN